MKTIYTLLLTVLEIIAPRRIVAPAARFAILADGATVDELTAKLTDIKAQADAIQLLARSENRELNDEEIGRLDALLTDFEGIKAKRDTMQRLANDPFSLDNSQGRAANPAQPQARAFNFDDPAAGAAGAGGAADPNVNANAAQNSPLQVTQNTPAGQWGFRSMGEFSRAVMMAHPGRGNVVDNRLSQIVQTDDGLPGGVRAAAGDTAMERIGEEGGFLIPPDFRQTIQERVEGPDDLLSRTDVVPVSGNQFVTNLDETTPWQTSGGVQAYWEGEGDQMQASRPKFVPSTVRANKLTALVICTDELLEDASVLEAYLGRKAPEKIRWKQNMAIVHGSGVGQPLGFLNHNATIQVAKESGQAADTILFANINKMYNAMYAPYLSGAVWLANQNIQPQLEVLTVDGTAGGHPIYIPGGSGFGGAADAPYGTLKGRPILFSEVANTLGDEGDLSLVNLKQYLSVVKSTGIRQDQSMHLYFDYGQTAFRFTKRVGGQPWWPNAISQRDGGGSLSHAVKLAERA